jgi:hypothetical protein
MDRLNYTYRDGTHQLWSVQDGIAAGAYAGDIDNQGGVIFIGILSPFLYLFIMKQLLLCLGIALAVLACNQKPQGKISRVLVVKNFMLEHPQWRLLNDTIVKDVTIGYKGLELPVQIKWRRAEDENGCMKIAIVEFTQVGGDTSILLHNFTFNHHPCIYKKGYNLIKKYERMDIDFEYLAKTTFREYKLKTNLGSIYGDGSEIFNMVYFLDKGENN